MKTRKIRGGYSLEVKCNKVEDALNTVFESVPETSGWIGEIKEACNNAYKRYVIKQNALSIIYKRSGVNYEWEPFSAVLTNDNHSYYFGIRRSRADDGVKWNIALSLKKPHGL